MTTVRLLEGKSVAIIGAGPGGLTLARLLRAHGVPVRVFERDNVAGARSQGGSLDLHPDSGQLALKKAGLLERFRAVARPEGQTYKVLDKHGTVRVAIDSGESDARPEIDRGQLRELLLAALDLATVVWDRQITAIEPTPAGRNRLVFKGGDTVEVDLVIGCDGTGSKVRSLLSPVRPSYSGVTFIETRVSRPDESCPAISRLVGPGALLALGDNKGLMCQRNADGHIRVYVALRVPEDWPSQIGIDFHRPADVRARLLSLFAGWSPILLPLLSESEDQFLYRPLFGLPADQAWTTRSGVTLLGDAAHVMPPFTGRGVNMAMLDAVELTECLTGGRFVDLTEAIRAYEHGMLMRMAAEIRAVTRAQETIIASDAPDRLVASMSPPTGDRSAQCA